MSRTSWKTIIPVGLFIVLTYIPFAFIVGNSVKSDAQIAQNPLSILWTFHVQNYEMAWNGIDRYLLNTVLVGLASVCVAIPFAAGAGYSFASMNFRFKKVLFYCFIGLMMIPWSLTLIPLFVEIKNMGMYGTWWGLILPYAAGSQPLLIYLFRIFFEGIPDELFESARIDGASELRILVRIVSPMSLPVFVTGILLMFINIWGDYLWPSIVLPNYHLLTISAGLQTFLGTFGYTGLGAGAAYAGYVIATLPIVIFVVAAMRNFINGITAGSMKG